MATIVYLSNQLIQAVEMKGSGKVSVYEELAPEGSIINGVITDEEIFIDFLKHFFATGKFSRKDCTLVINSSKISTRVFELPKAGHRDLNHMMLHEFGDGHGMDTLIVSLPMHTDRSSRMVKYLACAAEKTYIESFVKLFAQAGIEIRCIEPAMISFVRRFMDETSVGQGNCIVQIFDGLEVVSILLVDGCYLYSQRNRIFSDQDVEGLSREIHAVAQRLQQFATSQKIEEPVNRILIGGVNQRKLVVAMLKIEDADPDTSILEYRDSKLRIKKRIPSGKTPDFVYALERQTPDKKTNFIWKLHHDSPENCKKRERLRLLFPAVLVLLICLAVTFLLVNSFWICRESAQTLQESIQNQDEESTTYDLTESNLNRLRNQVSGARLLWSQLMSYPTITSSLNQSLQDCAGTDVEVKLLSFNRDTGEISIDATAARAGVIHDFIQNLQELSDFHHVEYSGYTYDHTQDCYSIHVSCVLKEGAEREEGE